MVMSKFRTKLLNSFENLVKCGFFHVLVVDFSDDHDDEVGIGEKVERVERMLRDIDLSE